MSHRHMRYHNSLNASTGYARGLYNGAAQVDQLFFTWAEWLHLGQRHGVSSSTMKLAAIGWPEGLALAQDITGAILDRYSASIRRPEMVYQDHPGMDFDLGLVLAGETEHWINIQHVDAERTYQIVLNCSVNNIVTGNAIKWRGASIAALVKLLELGGHRCEVVVMDATDNLTGGDYGTGTARVVECYVTVKEANADLDLDRVTFALAHPEMERGMMFTIEDRTSHGAAVECVPERRGDVYMGCSRTDVDWNDRKGCEVWVANQLRLQGVLMGT